MIIFCILLVAQALAFEAPIIRKVASFPFNKPAFVTAHANPLKNNSFDLIISSFGVQLPFQPNPDAVHFIPDIASAVKTNDFSVYKISDNIIWPNEVNLIDEKLVVAGGFLVPGKKGHISAINYEKFRKDGTESWSKLVDDSKGFYHRVEKAKILPAKEGDSGERLVSCRGWKGIFDSGSGEMVYLEPKGDGKFETKVIEQGCDCFFTQVDLNNDGVMEFIVPAFFGKKLFLMWTEHPDGDYSRRSFIRQRVMDDSIGAAFDVQHVDLDNDGIQEILVTNHESGGKGKIQPSLFAYKVVKPDFVTDRKIKFQNSEDREEDEKRSVKSVSAFMENIKFERFALSSNFSIINKSFMAAGPGASHAFYPHSKAERPLIVVSGDGSEKAYVVYPTGDGLESYAQEEFHDCKGTVGGILVEDLDKDGKMEIVVPCYDTNTVEIFTFDN